jgi:hypothetical protein
MLYARRSVPEGHRDPSYNVLEVRFDRMFPHSDHRPTQGFKRKCLSSISVNIGSQLLTPKS